ncbi:MAG: putative LPS assembly protein LptD [Saprospiraceae bacterium]
MKNIYTIILLFLLGLATNANGQDLPIKPTKSVTDTIPVSSDSLSQSIPTPVNAPNPSQKKLTVQISPDSPDDPVEYDCKDSMDYDIKNKKVYLYGEAVVLQNTLKLTAERITIDFGNNIVTAEGLTDTLGNRIGYPIFDEGEQNFSAKKIQFNFKTKKGKVYDAVTQEGDLYIHGSESKIFQGVKANPADTINSDIAYNRNSIFTTCNHPEPHFGIRCNKLKMVTGKVAVVGPSNIELGGIPTPLFLPFGFFPLKQGARTGLIFPRDYEFSETWGFGFRNVGWYFPINDNWDTRVTGDIYFKGTWGLNVDTRYKYRYKSTGNFNLAFSDRVQELADASKSRDRSLSLRWSHSQDRSAHPNRSFSASVNIQTNGFQSRNFNDANSVLDNSLSSNINYRQAFPGSPFNLTASMNHSQNTRSNSVTFNLPTVGLVMDRIFPFKKENRVGKEKWYERVTFKYDMNAQNRFTTTDTTLFTKQTLESAQYGMRHKVASDLNFKIFKFINVSPNINYTDVWYGNELEKEYVVDLVIVQDTSFNPDGSVYEITSDTTSYGGVEDNKINGFSRYFQLNAGVNLNTTRYFTKNFKKGFIRGIRHVAKPTVGFTYTPDYTNPEFGFYKDVISPETPLTEMDTLNYNVFANGIYGSPGSGGKQMRLTYGVRNNFEAKYWSRKDTVAKKFKLFNDINVNGDYNLAKDSLQWSDVRASGATRFFKGMTNVNLTASWSPYALADDRKTKINTFYWDTKKRPLRFVNAVMRTSTSISVKQIRDLFGKGKSKPKTGQGAPSFPGGNRDEDDTSFGSNRGSVNASRGSVKSGEGFLDLFENFRISYNFNLEFEPSIATGKDTLVITNHSIETRGNINLTDNWKVTVGRIGYNFKDKKVTFPDFSFYRDLHCWEMGMSWQPERTTYSFFLRVKPSSLDFIELPYKKNNADARFGGF